MNAGSFAVNVGLSGEIIAIDAGSKFALDAGRAVCREKEYIATVRRHCTKAGSIE
jgi:ATP-dependent protease HslVU (ClpYQ) peptidase subunit